MQTTTTIKTKIILKKTQTVEAGLGLSASAPLGERVSPIVRVDSSGKEAPAETAALETFESLEEFACARARPRKREKAQRNANVIFETFNVSPTHIQKNALPSPKQGALIARARKSAAESLPNAKLAKRHTVPT